MPGTSVVDEDSLGFDFSGPLDVGWIQCEFTGVDLGDKRLNNRLIFTAEKLAKSPLSPINEACGTWASTKASYRLFDNSKASEKAILTPHKNATVTRIAAGDPTVLIVQDTSFIAYGTHSKVSGLGPIGKTFTTTQRGLIMHTAVAFTTSGVALGILHQRIWARKDVPKETQAEKNARIKRTPLEEKESYRWILALREVLGHVPEGFQPVTIADRESDFFEFMTEASRLGTSYVVRAKYDRAIDSDDEHDTLMEAIVAAPVLGTCEVDIPGNGKRRTRTALVEIRSAAVTINPPRPHPSMKNQVNEEPLEIYVISAIETSPSEGSDAISWVLATNLPIKTFDNAVEKITWYGKRWGIETWHKILKSGCKVEECRLETAERLKRFLTLFSIISIRLMYVTHVARVQPNSPSTTVFSEDEIEALFIRVKKIAPTTNKPPTIEEAVSMIAALGGHLGRKSDGAPGITVLWRGFMRLHEDVEMLRSHKLVLSLNDTS
jgi:hypothetical protein